jgi:AraC-like DNA-binding protein
MKQLLFLMAQLVCVIGFAQDTTFVRSLPINSTVRNIDSDGEFLYLRFEDKFYKWKNNKLSFVQEGKFKYSWVNFDVKRNSIVISHNDIIMQNKINSAKKMENLIPGTYNYTITTAMVGNYLYMCYNGLVLEYKISPEITKIHKGNSIRHIYTEPGFRVISSYNGVFIDTIFDQFSNLKIDEKVTRYSNGEFVKIDSIYYLCQDNLITYDKSTRKLKTIINTEGTPRFRKLIKYNNKDFALYNNAFGEIDLKTGKRTYMIDDEFTDFIVFNDKLYISSLSSVLYELNLEGGVSKYNFKAPINDLSIFGNDLLIGTGSGLFSFKDSEIVEVIPNTEIIQALAYEGKIIFSNNVGLYYASEGEITPLIENIEFNKMALHQDQHFLYAGSVNGLYIIKNNQLKDIITNRPYVLKKSNYFFFIMFISLLLIIFTVILIVRRKRKKLQKKQDYLLKKKIIIDKQLVRNVVKNNPKILSVGQLAEYLATSVVQLNRNLKKENTTSLMLLKSTMKEIAIEMYNNGSSLEEISKRVGYSKRYIKNNFLKG